MLTIKDIVDLAKAGYKPADVKELIEISKSNSDMSSEGDPEGSPENPSKDIDTSIPVTPVKGSPEEDKQEEPDYKALYETTKIELDKAQKMNVRADISSDEDNKSDTDILKDLFKEFM